MRLFWVPCSSGHAESSAFPIVYRDAGLRMDLRAFHDRLVNSCIKEI
jgi:hypothetical protein